MSKTCSTEEKPYSTG